MTGGVDALRELARYCGAETDRWHAWLAEQEAAVLALPVGGAQIATVGTLLAHVAAVELSYSDALTGVRRETYVWPDPDSLPAIRRVHEEAFAALERFLDAADDAVLGEERTLHVPGWRLTASSGKMVAHLLVHGIRHYAQLAMKLREHGRRAPGEHDLITGEGYGPAGVFEREGGGEA